MQATHTNLARSMSGKRRPYLTGVGSVLDLSGDAAAFRVLCPKAAATSDAFEAIGQDFRAVGESLEKVVLRFFETLPPEKQLAVLRALRRWVAEQRRESGQYFLWNEEAFEPAASAPKQSTWSRELGREHGGREATSRPND